MLNENFDKIHAAFTDSTKRAVWMGMFLNHIKAKGKEDGSIPHGQFVEWLKKTVPSFSKTQVNVYMRLAVSVCEKGKFEIADFESFATNGELPPKISKMIEGQSQQELFLQFKNVDTDGNPLKPGCSPGKRGPAKDSDDDEETDFIDEVRSNIVDIADENDDALAKYPALKRDKLELAVRDLLQRILEIKRKAQS